MSKPVISVIDYGMGNLRSVAKALELAGANAVVTDDPRRISAADAIVLPGVGSFAPAMRNIKRSKLYSPIAAALSSGKPFLGICLGFQLLFDHSDEGGRHKGFGAIPGGVPRFDFKGNTAHLKIPHMGWNSVAARPSAKKTMFKGIPENAYFYFVHSYYGKPASASHSAAATVYGRRFCSAVIKGRVWACQFHPEKSGKYGLQLLRNFVQEATQC